MEITIPMGWWLAPLAFTTIAFATAYCCTPAPTRHGGFLPDFGPALIGAMNALFAIIGSLVAWLIWAVLT